MPGASLRVAAACCRSRIAGLPRPTRPLFSYKWPQTRDALSKLTEADGTPFEAGRCAYRNPATGGPVMPTIDCSIHLVPTGSNTKRSPPYDQYDYT